MDFSKSNSCVSTHAQDNTQNQEHVAFVSELTTFSGDVQEHKNNSFGKIPRKFGGESGS